MPWYVRYINFLVVNYQSIRSGCLNIGISGSYARRLRVKKIKNFWPKVSQSIPKPTYTPVELPTEVITPAS